MAFQVPTHLQRPNTSHTNAAFGESAQPVPLPQRRNEQSQEWVLFSPSQAASSTNRTQTTQTAGLSRASDLGTLNTAARSGRLEVSVLEDDPTEDGDLDSLDEGLHAFREPPLQPTTSKGSGGAVLPAHDGLGTFAASSRQVQDQLWQHEHFNPKRKFEGHHRRPSSIQRRLETLEEYDAEANDFKRMRIEKWRMEQSQALLEEVERVTRTRLRRQSEANTSLRHYSPEPAADLLGTTPKQSDYLKASDENRLDQEPFWRRITRKFIRDIIGIDEPLLSVILGESLPAEAMEVAPTTSTTLPTIPETISISPEEECQQSAGWRDRLLQRIARELGVLVHQISPHPGAFTSYSSASNQYAGMPISQPQQPHTNNSNWGIDDQPTPISINKQSTTLETSASSTDPLRAEREYWERELDIRMVFRYLKDRFIPPTTAPPPHTSGDQQQRERLQPLATDSSHRAAIIRQHHPLVAGRPPRLSSPAANRRRTPISVTVSGVVRPGSSCGGESAKSSRRSMSSGRHYWDLGGSAGSGSLLASGGLLGGWGEA